MSNLQLFLGIDKNNPLFSIYSPEDNPELLDGYFELALLENLESSHNQDNHIHSPAIPRPRGGVNLLHFPVLHHR